MTVVVIAPPDPVVTTDEAKAHLRVDHDDDDVLIDALIETATAWLDGPSGGWLGRAIGEQTLELRLDSFPYCPAEARLPYPPIVSVDSVDYIDQAGVEQPVTSDLFRLLGQGTGQERIGLVYGQSWPAVRYEPEAVRVTYVAGYPAGSVPAPIRQAILLLVGHLYENREAVAPGSMNEVPFTVRALLNPYRVFA